MHFGEILVCSHIKLENTYTVLKCGAEDGGNSYSYKNRYAFQDNNVLHYS